MWISTGTPAYLLLQCLDNMALNNKHKCEHGKYKYVCRVCSKNSFVHTTDENILAQSVAVLVSGSWARDSSNRQPLCQVLQEGRYIAVNHTRDVFAYVSPSSTWKIEEWRNGLKRRYYFSNKWLSSNLMSVTYLWCVTADHLHNLMIPDVTSAQRRVMSWMAQPGGAHSVTGRDC